MRVVDIITKKRDGLELSTEEITDFVQGYTSGDVHDYQAAAWLMAICIRGMSLRETHDLTMALVHSGEVINLSDVLPVSVDKHSSGGVGDKTSLVVLPLVAACGIPVAKMSGRGLGHSGGTLDKMESIAGYRVNLSLEEFKANAKKYGIVLAGQTSNLAPADGKLYALRDVTGTVSSLPLITSSIMSKKIAAGADAIVLDVKVGLGAFMPSIEEAQVLAQLMVDIGASVGRRVIALISDMNQPLGYAVGNALEVIEAVECMHGKGSPDLRQHCLGVAAQMLRLADNDLSTDALTGYLAKATACLDSGAAFEKFCVMVTAQGGDVRMVEDTSLLPKAEIVETLTASRSGYVSQLHAQRVGVASVELGAGRIHKSDSVDHAVGLLVHAKVGDSVTKGDPIFTLHANDPQKLEQAKQRLDNAIIFSDEPTEPLPAFYDVIRSQELPIAGEER